MNIEANDNDTDIKERLGEVFALVHESVENSCEDYFSRFRRRTYVTPKPYLSFLSSFKTLYMTQLARIQDDADRMKEGLSKCNAQKQRKKQHRSRNRKIAEINKKAQEMLEDALPVKQKAKAALETLTAQDINELGSYLKVTPLIQLILDCALILLRRTILQYTPEEYEMKGADKPIPCLMPSTDLGTALKKSTSLLIDLQGYNTSIINDEMIDLLRPYLALPFFNK